jgi:uncharacterized protein (DUF2062 family)
MRGTKGCSVNSDPGPPDPRSGQGLRRWLPSPESLQRNRWLRWLGPALWHPRLWHVSRRGIALGVSIGMFFGLLLPTAQIPCSAALAVVLRANLPAAVAATLVSNPVTSVPLYYGAWRLGSAVLGHTDPAGRPPVAAVPVGPPHVEDAGWLTRITRWLGSVGKPLMLGLALLACGCGLVAYFAVSWCWRAKVLWMRHRRLQRRTGAA